MRYLVLFISLTLLVACNNKQSSDSGQEKQTEIKSQEEQKVPDEKQVQSINEQKDDEQVADQNAENQESGKEVHILIKTPFGNMKAKLYNKTPKHRDNFVKLIKEGWYKGSPFHRVIKRFMIQGGQNADGTEDIGYTIPAEFVPGYIHKKGALAAARLADPINPQKASSGCQFYIVEGKTANDTELDMLEKNRGIKYTPEEREIYKTLGGTAYLDYNYTVFGEVYEGLDVIKKISRVQTDPNDKPLEDVRMDIEIIQE